MPHIKLTGVGLENLTGSYGGYDFENGVSTENVSQREADRLGCITGVENVDSGERMHTATTQEAALRPKKDQAEKQPDSETDEKDSETEKLPDSELYTEAKLGDIGDKDGISALREIAAPLGVKGTSIAGLIKGILEAQGK